MYKHLQKNLNDIFSNEEDFSFFGDPTTMDPEVVGDDIIYNLIEEIEEEDMDLDDIELDDEGLSLI